MIFCTILYINRYKSVTQHDYSPTQFDNVYYDKYCRSMYLKIGVNSAYFPRTRCLYMVRNIYLFLHRIPAPISGLPSTDFRPSFSEYLPIDFCRKILLIYARLSGESLSLARYETRRPATDLQHPTFGHRKPGINPLTLVMNIGPIGCMAGV